MRKKNEHLGRVKLLPEAIALIEKYYDDERDTLFPMIHYPSLRNHMKALAVLADVKEDTHLLRSLPSKQEFRLKPFPKCWDIAIYRPHKYMPV